MGEMRRQSDENAAPRPACSHCPPTCTSGCWPPDCECYRHQDWPDTRFDDALATRLTRCLGLPGCDGRSHDLRCNDALFRPATPAGDADA